MPTNSDIPGLPNASVIMPAYTLVGTDGAGSDVEIPVDLLKTFIGTATESFVVMAAGMVIKKAMPSPAKKPKIHPS